MIRKALLLAVAAALLGLSAACSTSTETGLVRTSGVSPPPPPSAPVDLVSQVAAAVSQPVQESAAAGEVEGTPFEVNLEDPGGSGRYVFDPGGLTFNVGDVIAFSLTGETEFHTFTVDDLDIDQAVDALETIRFSFTFDRSGTYDLICIPHEAQGMVGTITVR